MAKQMEASPQFRIGIESLSMRKLAKEFGVVPMALYKSARVSARGPSAAPAGGSCAYANDCPVSLACEAGSFRRRRAPRAELALATASPRLISTSRRLSGLIGSRSEARHSIRRRRSNGNRLPDLVNIH
jgi:hypothetical protein